MATLPQTPCKPNVPALTLQVECVQTATGY